MIAGVSLLFLPAATVARGRLPKSSGLDALAYLDVYDLDAAATIRWVEEHVAPDEVVLEAASLYPDW